MKEAEKVPAVFGVDLDTLYASLACTKNDLLLPTIVGVPKSPVGILSAASAPTAIVTVKFAFGTDPTSVPRL